MKNYEIGIFIDYAVVDWLVLSQFENLTDAERALNLISDLFKVLDFPQKFACGHLSINMPSGNIYTFRVNQIYNN